MWFAIHIMSGPSKVKNQRLLLDRERSKGVGLTSTELTALYGPTDLSQLADKADDRPDKAEKFADPTVVQISGDTCAQAINDSMLPATSPPARHSGRRLLAGTICTLIERKSAHYYPGTAYYGVMAIIIA
ncbi:hypothetical protein B0T13DRAFT_500667 [Neurospora crassa]|nr:hypothetical protein B0T13DRAFT_500667 [Neurospora crassa]